MIFIRQTFIAKWIRALMRIQILIIILYINSNNRKDKNKHIPIKVVKFHKYRHKKSNWIMKYRDKLYKQLKTFHPDFAEHKTCYINLKTHNTILKSIREL